MDMSSIDFTNLSEESNVFGGFDVDVETYVVLIPIKETSSSGTMAKCEFFSFSLINLSISTSISLIYAFCSTISFRIYFLCISISATYLVCEYSVGGSFNYFMSDDISKFFFLINSFVSLTLVGSYL
jgi:hypothetical protein